MKKIPNAKKSEIDAETEAQRMHLCVAHVEHWQDGIVGEKAQIPTTHAERSIQLELVHPSSVIILDLRPVGILHAVPLRDAQATGHARINVHFARRADFKHQWHLQKRG